MTASDIPGRTLRQHLPAPLGLAAAVLLLALASPAMAGTQAQAQELGPVDGHDLSPTDLERVQEGEVAPDFTLEARHGDRVTLSDFRGQRDIILVFFRGHW